jgi:hypothetical protein
MSRIQTLLSQILSAVYGKDVRGSIHDAIEECYTNVSTASTLADDAVSRANTAITATNTAKNNAVTATTNAITATNNTNAAMISANNAATNANNSASECDDVVAALPTQITNMFGSIGITNINGILCVEVERA